MSGLLPSVSAPVIPNRPVLFQRGLFKLRNGAESPWKIECDALTRADWEGLAEIAAPLLPPFVEVYGIPRGGVPFAKALAAYRTTDGSTETVLIADDVLTTGESMESHRRVVNALKFNQRGGVPGFVQFAGVVAFARARPPEWVTAVLSVGPPRPKSDEDLLAAAGWTVECNSPFEISNDDGSRATGQAADYVLAAIRAEAEGES